MVGDVDTSFISMNHDILIHFFFLLVCVASSVYRLITLWTSVINMNRSVFNIYYLWIWEPEILSLLSAGAEWTGHSVCCCKETTCNIKYVIFPADLLGWPLNEIWTLSKNRSTQKPPRLTKALAPCLETKTHNPWMPWDCALEAVDILKWSAGCRGYTDKKNKIWKIYRYIEQFIWLSLLSHFWNLFPLLTAHKYPAAFTGFHKSSWKYKNKHEQILNLKVSGCELNHPTHCVCLLCAVFFYCETMHL